MIMTWTIGLAPGIQEVEEISKNNDLSGKEPTLVSA